MLDYWSRPSQDQIFIEIAIWEADLVSWFYEVHPNQHSTNGVVTGVKGVYCSMWELRVVSDPDKVQKVEKFHILSILATEPDAMLYHLKVGIPGSNTDDLHNIFCQ